MEKQKEDIKHTPGPWFLQPFSDVYTNIIRPKLNDEKIAKRRLKAFKEVKGHAIYCVTEGVPGLMIDVDSMHIEDFRRILNTIRVKSERQDFPEF